MMPDHKQSPTDGIRRAATWIAGQPGKTALDFRPASDSSFTLRKSVPSRDRGRPKFAEPLAVALLIATVFFAWQRVRRGRRVRARTILRALFPKRILHSRSNEADIGYLIFNVFVYGVMFGWAVLSYQFISNGIISGLVALFGPVSPSTLPAT